MPANMDTCAAETFCEYETTVLESGMIECGTNVVFCPTAGGPWQQRTFPRCPTDPQTEVGTWNGLLVLLFVETAGTCGSLGRYDYHIDENRLDEYLCEVVFRDATGTNVAEALRCTHESSEITLNDSLTMTWTGKFWEGTAEVSLFSESSEIDCTSTYTVRAESP